MVFRRKEKGGKLSRRSENYFIRLFPSFADDMRSELVDRQRGSDVAPDQGERGIGEDSEMKRSLTVISSVASSLGMS